MGTFPTLGPNMRRLGEMQSAKSVAACGVAGPGELLVCEVRASFDVDDLPFRRGPAHFDANQRSALGGEAIEVSEGALDVVEGVIGLVLLDDEPVDAG